MILTKYNILDRNFCMSKLIPLLSIINLGIYTFALDWKITLHAIVTCKNITDKVFIFCKYKNKYS